MLLVSEAGEIKASRGDHPYQRLTARALAGFDDVVNLAVWVRVDFVENGAMRVEAVKAFAVAAKRKKFVCTSRLRVVKLVSADSYIAAQQRRCFDHPHGFCVRDARLLHFCRGRVDLGAALSIELKEVQADAGKFGALPVLARNLFPHFAESPRTIIALPAKRQRNPELLPGRQFKLLAGPLAFAMPKEQERLERVLRVIFRKPQAPQMPGLHVAVVPLDA